MSKFKFLTLSKKMERERVKTLDAMSKTAVVHFKQEAFKDKAWDGVPWKPRKDSKPHPLLMKTKAMNNSIRELRRTTYSRIVGSDVRNKNGVNYAKFHNSGTPKMPKRQFIGMTKMLNIRLMALIDNMVRNKIKHHVNAKIKDY